MRLECANCGHMWRPRLPVTYETSLGVVMVTTRSGDERFARCPQCRSEYVAVVEEESP